MVDCVITEHGTCVGLTTKSHIYFRKYKEEEFVFPFVVQAAATSARVPRIYIEHEYINGCNIRGRATAAALATAARVPRGRGGRVLRAAAVAPEHSWASTVASTPGPATGSSKKGDSRAGCFLVQFR